MLALRVAAPGEPFGAWQPAVARGRRGLLLAPTANLALAYHAAVEHLARTLGDLDLPEPEPEPETEPDLSPEPEVVALPAYQVVADIAHAHVPAALRGIAGARFQWKLVEPASAGGADVLVAPEQPA